MSQSTFSPAKELCIYTPAFFPQSHFYPTNAP